MFKILYTVTIFIGIVILLRAVCKDRISARLQYAIWLLVAVKLLVFPMPNVAGEFSVLGFVAGTEREQASRELSAEELQKAEESGLAEEAAQKEEGADGSLWNNGQGADGEIVPGTDTGAAAEYIGPESGSVSGFGRWRQKMSLRLRHYVEEVLRMPVWLAGILCTGSVVCAAWMTGYHVRLGRYLKRRRAALPGEFTGREAAWQEDVGTHPAVKDGGRNRKGFALYSVEGLPTPCLFGRDIYVPAQYAEDRELLPYILHHERCHYLHGDGVWGFVRMLCVCLYWYHPLVWWAAYLSRQDCELACDEAVVKRMEGPERKRYGELLLGLAAIKPSPANCLSLTTAMSGSARQLKQRLERITGRKKSWMALGILAAAVALLGIYACVTKGFVETGRQWQWIQIKEQEGSVPLLQESYELSYRLSKDAASYGFYAEQYEYGKLVSVQAWDSESLAAGQSGKEVKRGTANIYRTIETDETTGNCLKAAISYTVQDHAQTDGATSLFKAFSLELPENCAGNSFSFQTAGPLRHRFRMNEDIVLAADYYGSGVGTEMPDGTTVYGHLQVPGGPVFSAEEYREQAAEALENDRCVILLHLIVSDRLPEELDGVLSEIVKAKLAASDAGGKATGNGILGGEDGGKNGEDRSADSQGGFDNAQLLEMAENYYRREHVFAPAHVEIDSENGDSVVIWLYDMNQFLNEDGEIAGSTNTRDWYTVDRKTGRGENIWFEEIDLTEAWTLCRPWEGNLAEKTVVDVSREEDFSALSAEPEAGAADRLYLLGETDRFRLYGAGDYRSLLWEEGDFCTEIGIPFIVDGITMMAPDMQEADYDGDGEPELAVKFLWGEGTGVWVENLWMFDKEAGEARAYEYHAGDYEEELLQELSWEEVDGERRILLDERPVTPFLRETEGASCRDAGINTERVSFVLENGQIRLRTLLRCGSREGSVMPAYGDAVLEAEVFYTGNGNFSLGDVASADMEAVIDLAQEAVRELYAPREITILESRYHLGTWRFSEEEGERMEMTLTILADGEDSYDYAEVPLVRSSSGAWETEEILIQK